MKIKALALAGIIGLGTLGLTTGASADVAAEYDTKANIFFEINDDVTVPVDPEDPDKEVDPEVDPEGEDPIEPGTKGPLSIDYASHINFGSVKISGNKETYFANPIQIGEAGERAPYVQVTDSRGTKAGWELQVSQAAEFATAGGAELTGSELTLANGEVNSNSDFTNITATDVTFENHDELYPVVNAAVDNGAGTFTNQFGKIVEGKATDVSLTVPADLKIEKEKYSTDLNWVLVDTP